MGSEVEKLFEEILTKYETERKCYIEDNYFGDKKYSMEDELQEEIKEYRERYKALWWR